MNYQVLKAMMENLVKTYKCPFCNSEVSENNVDIVWAAGSTLNIWVNCPKCHKNSIVKAEVAQIWSGWEMTPENIEQLKKWLNTLKDKLKAQFPGIVDIWYGIENISQKNKSNWLWKQILDKDIIELDKKIKNKKEIYIEDLFND